MQGTKKRRPDQGKRRNSGNVTADQIVSKIALLCASAAALVAASSAGGLDALVVCVAAYGGIVAGYAVGRSEAAPRRRVHRRRAPRGDASIPRGAAR